MYYYQQYPLIMLNGLGIVFSVDGSTGLIALMVNRVIPKFTGI